MSLIKNRLWLLIFIIQIGMPNMGFSGVRIIPKEKEDETLIHGRMHFGGYGAPIVKLGNINDQFAVLVGGRGGLVINHAFVLGGAGYGLVNRIDIPDAPWPQPEYLNFGYGGVFFELVFPSPKLLHLSFHTLIGCGGVCYEHDYYGWHDDAVFVLEPGMDLELNVTKYFRIGIGGTFRYVGNVDLAGLSNEDMSNFNTALTFKFGHF